MRIVMVGSGKVGTFLAKELSSAGHAVMVIEKRQDRATEVAEDTGVLVVHGDGTDIDLLAEINLKPSDLVIALTGVDETNFVSCHIARNAFNVANTLARLNDPRNQGVFEALEIPVVSVADLLMRNISREMELTNAFRLAWLAEGAAGLVEAVIPSHAEPRGVQAVNGPHGRVLLVVRAGTEMIVPGPSTELLADDHVLLAVHSEHEEETIAALTGAEVTPTATPSPHVFIIEDVS